MMMQQQQQQQQQRRDLQEHRQAPLLISVEEAATMLGIGRTHAYALVRWGVIQSVKIGRTRRVVVSSLEAYIQRLLSKEA